LKVNPDFFNRIITKAIAKDNSRLAFELYESISDAIEPNDTMFITLIEAAIESDRVIEATSLFTQAYLHNQVLDLLVIEKLLNCIREFELDCSYIIRLYRMLRRDFMPRASLFETFLKSAFKMPAETASTFIPLLIADAQKGGIDLMTLHETQTRGKKSRGREREREMVFPTKYADDLTDPLYILEKNPRYANAPSKREPKYLLVSKLNMNDSDMDTSSSGEDDGSSDAGEEDEESSEDERNSRRPGRRPRGGRRPSRSPK
jgi:hypothetical protein